jgi:hypothetical protein
MSTRIIRSFARLTATATVVSAAALTASALPASASTYAVLYGYGNANNGFDQDVICTPPGTHGVETSALDGVIAVQNFCGTRLWLHQFSNGSGWSYCVSPRSYATLPGWAEFPAQLLISENTAAC